MSDFETAPFRGVAKLCEDRIAEIKDAAVSMLSEPDGAHAHRVGRIQGIRDALECMRQVEKDLLGVRV